MVVVSAQKIPKKKITPEDTLATFCFYFQQYTYNEARKLPFIRVKKMLEIAEKERARFMYDLVQVVSAPHTKRGIGVRNMLKYFKDIILS